MVIPLKYLNSQAKEKVSGYAIASIVGRVPHHKIAESLLLRCGNRNVLRLERRIYE